MSKIKELQKEIEKLQKEIQRVKEAEKPKQCEPNCDDNYWSIDDEGKIWCGTWTNSPHDIRTLSIANVYLTPEEAELELEKRKVIAELKRYSSEFVMGEDNYSIVYKHPTELVHGFLTHEVTSAARHDTLYFSSKERIEKAIEVVGEERIRKYYFGIKDSWC